MTRTWAVMAGLLLAVGAWLGLAAGDEKDVDDLALVPPSARLIVSSRPAEAWDSELGKAIRKGMPRELAEAVSALKALLGAGPDQLERVTFFTTKREDSFAYALRFRGKFDGEKVLARLAPKAVKEKVGERVVFVSGRVAYFVRGNVMLYGPVQGVKEALQFEGKRSEGQASAIKRIASGKHAIVGYFDMKMVPEMARKEVPQALAFLQPLFGVKEAVAWADVGATAKASARLTFADEAAAKRCEKTLVALRALGIATLASMADELKKAKDLAPLAADAEKALEGAAIKRDGSAIDVGLTMTVRPAPLVFVLKQAVEQMGIAAKRSQSAQNLKQIGLAMHNYHDAHGTFPPQAIYSKDGKALLSWRVLILPYIEQNDLYKKFKLDEPWDSPHNKKLIPLMPRTYLPVTGKPTEKHGTYYQVFFGLGAAFQGKRGLRINAFTDGLSNTIMVIEAGKDVVWTKPEDIPFDGKNLPKLGGMFEDGFNTLMCDGSVRFLSRKISETTLKAAITRADGDILGSDF
jgi:hypothetical protein